MATPDLCAVARGAPEASPGDERRALAPPAPVRLTIIFHDLFPVLTMGLALLIMVMKGMGLRPGGESWNDA